MWYIWTIWFVLVFIAGTMEMPVFIHIMNIIAIATLYNEKHPEDKAEEDEVAIVEAEAEVAIHKLSTIKNILQLINATKQYRCDINEKALTQFLEDTQSQPVIREYAIMTTVWQHFGVRVDIGSPCTTIRFKNTSKYAVAIAKCIQTRGCNCKLKYDETTSHFIIEVRLPQETAFGDITWIIHDGICAGLNLEAQIKSTIFQHWRTGRACAATSIQSAFRGWKTRKENTWNPKSVFGRWMLEKQVTAWIAEDGDIFSFKETKYPS